MSKNKLQKIVIQNTDGDAVIEIEMHASITGFLPVAEPKLAGTTKMTLYYGDDEEFESYEGAEVQEKLDNLVNEGKITITSKNYENPKITYEDVTEKMILGSEPIKMESLRSQTHGLWATSGRRKFEISFDCVECFLSENMGLSTKVEIEFDRLNGEKISGDVSEQKTFLTDAYALTGDKVTVEVDTDMFDDAFTGKNEEKKHLKVDGFIKVRMEKGKQSVTYKYPIELYVINTKPTVCDCVSKLPASIDFGTSSTCVAIENEGKNELLTLSPLNGDSEEEQGNIFENPTNIMIYDWASLYKEWTSENIGMPAIYKGNRIGYTEHKREPEKYPMVEYDFGYSVKSILGDEYIKRKELNAILSLIKMIPYQLLKEEQQIQLIPYGDANKFIDIICDLDKQGEANFNPVAFYGYLIGRAVNDISKHDRIYTQFQITSPVMFDDKVKEALRASLEYGLKRAVPKNLRELVKVKITHTEPVAYIGALCGTEYFQVEEDEQKMFAVYDFGGGTLDFSYGIASNEDDDLKIDIIKVGGKENFGGESLIERLAYEIYLDNEKLREREIPFIKPYGEELPDDIDERLVQKTDYARANMNIVSSRIARKFFEGKKIEPDYTLYLYDMDGKEIECPLSVDEALLETKLEKLIIPTVEEFAHMLNEAFVGYENFDVQDVYIFKAGNSSRSRFVEQGMEKCFPGHKHIQLVDQSSDERKSKRYAITPKTAVAIGQLKLNNMVVEKGKVFFRYYVGFFNEGTGKFKAILARNHKDGIWYKFKKIKNAQLEIQYAASIPEDNSQVLRKTIELKDGVGKTVFIRIKDETTIEYCISDCEDASTLNEVNETIETLDLR